MVQELVGREFAGRYRNSLGGALWTVVQPLLMLVVYTLAFSLILKSSGGAPVDPRHWSLRVFAGLIVFNAFADCLKRGPTLVSSHPNFVKKVVFPLEVLPWVQSLAALANAAVGLGIWIVAYVAFVGLPEATLLYFPLIVLAYLPLLLGVGFMLAALGVVARDLEPLMGVISNALLFLTPIFFDRQAAPLQLQRLLLLNPLTFVVEQTRRVLLLGLPPDLAGLALYAACAALFSVLSLRLFLSLRPRFADLV